MIFQNQAGMMFILQNLLGTDVCPSQPAEDAAFLAGRSPRNSKQQRARHCTHQTKY